MYACHAVAVQLVTSVLGFAATAAAYVVAQAVVVLKFYCDFYATP
jgi:hypothetical protein